MSKSRRHILLLDDNRDVQLAFVALFERIYRRWSFAPAAAVSTAAAIVRYLADPLLPHSLGIAAGATFYMAVLGVGNCWLFARTGVGAATSPCWAR